MRSKRGKRARRVSPLKIPDSQELRKGTKTTVNQSELKMGYGGATSVPYRGGNSNNGAHCGAFYVNLNNTASNANWNIGAAQSYPGSEQ